MSAYKVLVCGSRNWQSVTAVHNVLGRYRDLHGVHLAVMHGDCPNGADRAARMFCELLGVAEMRFPAHWDAHKRAAGPLRNGWMLTFGQPSVVWAFRSSPDSRGTNDMIRQAMKGGYPVYVMELDGKVGVFNDEALCHGRDVEE